MFRQLSLHTLDLSISSDIDALACVVDRCYASNILDGPRSSMQIEISGEAEETFAPGAMFAETMLCGGHCYFDRGRLTGAAPDAALAFEYEFATDRLRVRVGAAHRADPHRIVIDVLRPVLQSFLLPLHGLKPLHGAVIARADRGVFLAGGGGAGKSTTAVQAASDGWDVLADDGPLFAFVGGAVRALSSLDFMHVSEKTLALFPDLERHRISGRDTRGKFAIDGRAVAANGSRQRPVAVTHYVELQRSNVAVPRLEPMDRAAMLRTLIAEQMFVVRNATIRSADPRLPQMSDFILDLLSSFARQAAFHRLVYADEHLAAVPGMLELL